MRLIRTWALALAAFTVPAVAAVPAGADAPRIDERASSAVVDLTAHRTRIGNHPGFVRVVVDFTDGTMDRNDSEAVDPDPFDGRAIVDVRHQRVQAQAPVKEAHGVRVRITQGTNRIRVRLTTERGRFKYVDRGQLRDPERLVLDLYKSRPPRAGAEIRSAPGGCLELERWFPRAGRVRVEGSAASIFESQFQLLVRGVAGRVEGTRHVTFAASGIWRRTVRYDVGRTQAGTLEAVALSARDGTLDCLVQVRVRLRP